MENLRGNLRNFVDILGKLGNFERNEVSLGGSPTINSTLVGVGWIQDVSLARIGKKIHELQGKLNTVCFFHKCKNGSFFLSLTSS